MKIKRTRRSKAGKPYKLTPELTLKICDAVRAGNYIETAAALCGISKVSFYDWLKKGERKQGAAYELFAVEVRKAMADSEVSDVSVLSTAAEKGQWQASAWRLERKYPQRWAQTNRIEMTGKDGGPVEIADPREILRDRIALMSKRRRARKDTQEL